MEPDAAQFQLPPGAFARVVRACSDPRMRKIKAQVKRFDFSSHSGSGELKEAAREVEGNPTVFVVHGAEGNCEKFAEWIRKEVGLEAVAPKTGDIFPV